MMKAPSSGPSKGVVTGVLVGFLILSLLWIGLNIYFYSKSTFIYKKYTPKKGPAGAVYPNGLPASAGGNVGTLPPSVLAHINNNLQNYQSTNLKDVNQWGAVQS
jgi:hypothetical protein